MRKIFILLTMVSWSLLSMAQVGAHYGGVFGDNGKRVIYADYDKLFKSRVYNVEFSLSCINSEKPDAYFLDLRIKSESKLLFEKGRKLLIKFDDGEVMELTNITKVGENDNLQTTSGGRRNYYMMPSYLLLEGQIATICSKNAVKIRIESDNAYYDKEISGKKFSKNMRKQLSNVIKALAVNKDITAEF